MRADTAVGNGQTVRDTDAATPAGLQYLTLYLKHHAKLFLTLTSTLPFLCFLALSSPLSLPPFLLPLQDLQSSFL